MHHWNDHDDRENSGNIDSSHMYELRKTDPASSGSDEVSLPKLWRNPDKTMRKMQKVRSPVQVSKMRVYRTIIRKN